MKSLEDFEIKAKHFRCFGEKPQGFDKIQRVNVIIGKNNSGKSALIQLVGFATTFTPSLNVLGHNKNNPTVFLKGILQQSDIEKVFMVGHGSGYIPGRDDREYGVGLIGQPLTIQLKDGNTRSFSLGDNPEFMTGIKDPERETRGSKLANNLLNPLQGKQFRRLSAERDIVKEVFSGVNKEGDVLKASGAGATNLIANFLNNKGLEESKVEEELLGALQVIYGNDADFTRIQTQMDTDTQEYEIFLEEKKKGDRIALSDSGSSLKTILLVLLNVILVPALQNKDLQSYVFAFEELENNLHPSLQRRLLSYLMELARQKGCVFFLTTHSNVVIDVFSHQEDAQILHVKHDGTSAVVEAINTHIDKCNVLDDLDFRASDVLQANGVIWVEGPTDRIYLKKWIDLWSNGEIEEDIHYQFVFYGGSVRKHLSALDPEEVESAISVFRINRNAVVVMDSDRDKKGKKLESSKMSLIKEMKEISTAMTFVTQGRDIENYINPEVIKNHYSLQNLPKQVGLYENFEDYLNRVKKGKGTTFKNNKVLFAERVKDFFVKEELSKVYDIDKQMKNIVSLIKIWNKK